MHPGNEKCDIRRIRHTAGGEMAIKYQVMVAAVVVLALIVIGDGYLRTRRADQNTSVLKSRVSAMSIQQLARASEECDSAQSPGGEVKHEAAYCAEVFRAIEAEPLQIVEMPPSSGK